LTILGREGGKGVIRCVLDRSQLWNEYMLLLFKVVIFKQCILNEAHCV